MIMLTNFPLGLLPLPLLPPSPPLPLLILVPTRFHHKHLIPRPTPHTLQRCSNIISSRQQQRGFCNTPPTLPLAVLALADVPAVLQPPLRCSATVTISSTHNHHIRNPRRCFTY